MNLNVPPTRSPKATTGTSTESITNYTSAIRWLYTHTNYELLRIVPYNERTFSLERMSKLLQVLGNPHKQIKCVQVAGTKGKGSTCAMVASVLRTCGYTVGSYQSPHLVDLRERISIDQQIISHADLTEIFKEIEANHDQFEENPPSERGGGGGTTQSTPEEVRPIDTPITWA